MVTVCMPAIGVGYVNLRYKTSSYLFRSNRELESSRSQLRPNHWQVQRTKERSALLWKKGGSWKAVKTKNPLESTGSSEYKDFPLAEL